MIYSDITLKVLAAKECGLIKSNAQFWKSYSNIKSFNEIISNSKIESLAEELSYEFDNISNDEGLVSVFDDFPFINKMVKRNSDKPYLLFYKGNITLLDDLNRNVAIVGLTDTDNSIIQRENAIVKQLVSKRLNIVSGLARGCDTIAHATCLESGGKTIAVLPTQLGKIYPAENKRLAEKIVNNGGLLITEYYREPKTKYEAINRFIERDRLQAMFSKAVILVASYEKGEGDSGSRHAMNYAEEYGIARYAMYNVKTDKDNPKFGLNKNLTSEIDASQAKILTSNSIEYLDTLNNANLLPTADIDEQMVIKLNE